MAVLCGAAPVRADYQLCNRTSYVLDAALGIETGGATATQGWFQIAPGVCTIILSGAWTGERYFLHTRTPDFYREVPQARHVSRMFCVKRRDFLIPGAEKCADAEGVLAAFSEFVPDRDIRVTTTDLTGDSQFSLAQARVAGVQRLLTLLDFDPGGIDGEVGETTQLAIADFIAAYKLPERYTDLTVLMDELLKAAQERAASIGLTLCNATPHMLMAAIGAGPANRITAQGWYELAANTCRKVLAAPLDESAYYAFAEAVSAGGRPVVADGRALAWQGGTMLCTRDLRFEIAEHADCAARGLRAVGFALLATGGARGYTMTFDEANASTPSAAKAAQ